jgi:hypothetical protein
MAMMPWDGTPLGSLALLETLFKVELKCLTVFLLYCNGACMHWFERRVPDREVMGSTHGRSTSTANQAIHPTRVDNLIPASAGI